MFLYFFYAVMYALFVLSVHVCYVKCNAKTQIGYLCASNVVIMLHETSFQIIYMYSIGDQNRALELLWH